MAWAVVEREVKLGKVQRPPSLLSVQLLGGMEVLKVLVVHPNLKLAWGAFEVVLPLLQCMDDWQHLLVMDFVVPLDRAEALEKKAIGCHFPPFSDKVCWDETAPVAMSEELASMW